MWHLHDRGETKTITSVTQGQDFDIFQHTLIPFLADSSMKVNATVQCHIYYLLSQTYISLASKHTCFLFV